MFCPPKKETESQGMGREKRAAPVDRNKFVYTILVERLGGILRRRWENILLLYQKLQSDI